MAAHSALPSSEPTVESDDGDSKASDADTKPKDVEPLTGRRFGCPDTVR